MNQWFKAKKYGLGWTPSSWQGWSILFVYCLLVVLLFMDSDQDSHSASDTLINFIPSVLVLTLILILVSSLTGRKKKYKNK